MAIKGAPLKSLTAVVKSPKSFEETCRSIEERIGEFADEGWGFPFDSWDFYKVFQTRNLIPRGIKNLRVYFLCNAKIARKMINADESMMGIMPCSWAVYEKENGDVNIAKLDIRSLAEIFDGDIKEAFLEVDEAEKRMLSRVLS